ncbi:hypothetical protein V2A60_006682 [Cordyceps javanica]
MPDSGPDNSSRRLNGHVKTAAQDHAIVKRKIEVGSADAAGETLLGYQLALICILQSRIRASKVGDGGTQIARILERKAIESERSRKYVGTDTLLNKSVCGVGHLRSVSEMQLVM